jgi:hypothetical protein
VVSAFQGETTTDTPDPNLNARIAVLEEIAAATKDVLVDMRDQIYASRIEHEAEMRSLRAGVAALMHDMRAAQRADFRWLLSVTLVGFGVILGAIGVLLGTRARELGWF